MWALPVISPRKTLVQAQHWSAAIFSGGSRTNTISVKAWFRKRREYFNPETAGETKVNRKKKHLLLFDFNQNERTTSKYSPQFSAGLFLKMTLSWLNLSFLCDAVIHTILESSNFDFRLWLRANTSPCERLNLNNVQRVRLKVTDSVASSVASVHRYVFRHIMSIILFVHYTVASDYAISALQRWWLC